MDDHRLLREMLKSTVKKVQVKLEDANIQMLSKFDEKFQIYSFNKVDAEYVKEAIKGLWQHKDYQQLYRSFRQIESEFSRLKDVIFTGYQSEAEFVLNNKIDRNEFENLKTSQKQDYKVLDSQILESNSRFK